MQGAEFLLTIAEISLAFVGFSAVIVAFRQAGGRTWSQFERLLIRGMIELGFAALFFALVPHILVYLHFPDPWVWGLSSTSFGLFMAGYNVNYLIRRRRVGGAAESPVRPVVLYTRMSISFLIAAALILSAFDVLVPRGVGAYALGVTWLLALGAIFFLVTLATAEPPSQSP
jgi:hypothetical protein